MKILTANQIKEADLYTIEHEPVSSIDLMERASQTIAEWFIKNISTDTKLVFIVGKGNNGGDGLAVARILSNADFKCSVFLVFDESEFTAETYTNFKRLPSGIAFLKKDALKELSKSVVIVDAILGTGVKNAIKEPVSTLINRINELPNKVISIDLPSGMFTEFDNKKQCIIKADITLTLQFPKLAMLLPEAGENCGNIHILPIGLSSQYLEQAESSFYFVDDKYVATRLLSRSKFAYKNKFGHSLLVCGSQGMIGAAVLSTKAALRSGCGLVTAHIPFEERAILQISCPSAMLSLDNGGSFSQLPDNLEKYNVIGCGCGLGKTAKTVSALNLLLSSAQCPVVLDADALNIIAEHTEMQQLIPENSILTPHLGELQRLAGKWTDEKHKFQLVKSLSEKLNSVVIVKGAHTMTCLPDGTYYFNSTGNSGMAKGGSGDVLTGLITGLLARGYSSADAATIGVYLHGQAGDKAAEKIGVEYMNSEDLIRYLNLFE